jgi:F-type H+-transporting ATPase subunit gamma
VHPFLARARSKRVGYIIVSTDRGLCGGLNSTCSASCSATCASGSEQGVEIDLALHRQKARSSSAALNIVRLGHPPRRQAAGRRADRRIKVMLDAYSAGDRPLFLAYNDFVNTMTQKPRSTSCCRCRPSRRRCSTTGTTSTSRTPKSVLDAC